MNSMISVKRLVEYKDSAATIYDRKKSQSDKMFSTRLDSSVSQNEKKQETFNSRDLKFANTILSSLTKFSKDKQIVIDIINNATNRQFFTEKELNMISYIYTKNIS